MPKKSNIWVETVEKECKKYIDQGIVAKPSKAEIMLSGAVIELQKNGYQLEDARLFAENMVEQVYEIMSRPNK